MARNAVEDALDALAPKQEFDLDWQDVLGRANRVREAPAHSARRRLRKRWLIALAVAIAVVTPLSAVGAVEEWWFFRSIRPPASTPEVLRTGTWAGVSWELVGYRTADEGLCYTVIRAGSPRASGAGTVTGCGGSPEGHQRGSDGQGGIGFFRGSVEGLPGYIVGPVIEGSQNVSVRLSNGETITTPTFEVSESLGAVDFYAAHVPADATVAMLTARAADGQVVACADLVGSGTCARL
jgi:hypothetical protein